MFGRSFLLPGLLSLGFLTNFGFGHSEAYPLHDLWRDRCLALLFALFALGLAAAGVFLIIERDSTISKGAKALLAIGAIAGLFPAISAAIYLNGHSVSDAEDRRRWLREIDDGNEKAGFFKDANGGLIYVGVTNSRAGKKDVPGK